LLTHFLLQYKTKFLLNVSLLFGINQLDGPVVANQSTNIYKSINTYTNEIYAYIFIFLRTTFAFVGLAGFFSSSLIEFDDDTEFAELADELRELGVIIGAGDVEIGDVAVEIGTDVAIDEIDTGTADDIELDDEFVATACEDVDAMEELEIGADDEFAATTCEDVDIDALDELEIGADEEIKVELVG
jgi:hypothetical protein